MMKELDTDGFLQDESRLQGEAERVVVASSEADIVALLAEAREHAMPVTTQGGLTGITGSAVPHGGWVLNLRNMQKVLGLREDANGFILRLEPGCTLDGIRRMLLEPEKMETAGWSDESVAAWQRLCRLPAHMFAPDLTETGATLGGVVSTNGSGARSYRYGAARNHIAGLRVVLAGGDVLALRRGQDKAQGLQFKLDSLSGRTYTGQLPSYKMPDVKHAAGYYACENMDLVDLFVGSEGTLGVISEVEICLLACPQQVCGLTVFLPDEPAALALVEKVRKAEHAVYAIEYFSSEALALLRDHDSQVHSGVAIPKLADHWHTAIYIEFNTENPDTLLRIVEMLVSVGGNEADTWLAEGYAEIQTLKGIRHAIPERINSWIADQRKRWPNVTKLGTDLAVPDAALREVMQMYHADLQTAGLQYVIFGHIGNNHVHVNILPCNQDAWQRGKTLYKQWAGRVIAMGGTVSAEHGIGKLKADMLRMQFGDKGIAEMRAVKSVFDPAFLLNRGTLFAVD